MTLEQLLREAAENGRLNHLSVAHTTRGWQAAFRGAAHADHAMATHKDPVAAIVEALTATAPKKRQRQAVKPEAAPAPSPANFDDLLG